MLIIIKNIILNSNGIQNKESHWQLLILIFFVIFSLGMLFLIWYINDSFDLLFDEKVALTLILLINISFGSITIYGCLIPFFIKKKMVLSIFQKTDEEKIHILKKALMLTSPTDEILKHNMNVLEKLNNYNLNESTNVLINNIIEKYKHVLSLPNRKQKKILFGLIIVEWNIKMNKRLGYDTQLVIRDLLRTVKNGR